MAAETRGSAKLDIGVVIQGTFDALRRNFVALLPAMAALLMAPGLVNAVLASRLLVNSEIWGFYAATILLSVLGWAVFQALAARVFVADLDGGKTTVRDHLRPAVSAALPVIGILILQGLAFSLGLVLLIVPGFMIMTALSVALQAKVVERVGVFAAFDRSRALTRGNRRRIFLLMVIYFVIFMVFEGVVLSLTGGLRSATAVAGLGTTIALTLLGEFAGLLALAGQGALYVELRRIKDGVGPSDLAAVFD